MTESYVKSWYGNLKQNMSENVKFHLQSLCFFIFFCFFSLNCWILHPVATFPEKETVWLSDRWKDRKCKNMVEGILAYIMKTVKSWRTKDPQHSFHLSSSLNVLMELQQRFIHTSALHQWHDEGFTLLVISAHSRLTNQNRSVLRLTGAHHHSFSTFDFLQWLRFTDGARETCRSVSFSPHLFNIGLWSCVCTFSENDNPTFTPSLRRD